MCSQSCGSWPDDTGNNQEMNMADNSVERALKLDQLQERAKQLRRQVIEILGQSTGGHYGGALSAADILSVLYFDIMRYRSDEPSWPDRDRFILSKGHVAVVYCAALAMAEFFPYRDVLNSYNALGSPYAMHCDMTKIVGCDFSAGSLGHGLAAGVGMALAGKIDARDYRVFVMSGDADLQEGSTWEAVMSASHYKLDNLCCIIDRNRICVDGNTEDIMAVEPLGEKWRAFNWDVRAIDGHDVKQIRDALQDMSDGSGRPRVVLAATMKGKGVSFMEDRHEWHYGVCTPDMTQAALEEIG
jgi:transketolase